MLCTKCRERPAVSVDGRCTGCATLYPKPAHGPMTGTPVPRQEAWQRLRSPVGLARAVVVLLSAVVVADLLAVAAGLNIRGVVGAAIADDFASFDETEADRADVLYFASGLLQIFAVLATATVFIIWFHRTRQNAEVFDASLHSMRPGWSIGGWFIPIASFWLPRRIARDIWTASAQTNRDGSWRTASMALLNWWWGVWVISQLFSRTSSQQYRGAEQPQEIMDAAGQVIAADLLNIVAAVLAILFVRKLTRMQGERAALGANPYAEPVPTSPVPS
jgi:hypothetical protein